ncbi:hypothetical protein [Caballeronia sp. LZ001]|uniref:hypothetical protein n=1 Tax=Caballeronia sp. LZ001 TaxID=3038553 RepID=UPI00285EDB53|nr:hypothetical protein [Caballeronia sp. LZ001]MDR5802255.1 hypothetical protein [Caballeronia sp. LZ001]
MRKARKLDFVCFEHFDGSERAGWAVCALAYSQAGWSRLVEVVDLYNRQLHPGEKKAIKDLANGDADKEHRLEAAGCALVHCAAEYAPGTADYTKLAEAFADKADLTNQFLGGYSYGGNGCLFGICGGLNHAVGGQTAIEAGLGVGA